MKKQITLFVLLTVLSVCVVVPHQMADQDFITEETIHRYQEEFGFEKEKQKIDQEHFQVFQYVHDSIQYSRDVTYKRMDDGQVFRLDYAAPKKEGKYPLIVCLHPGGWTAGSKDEMSLYLYTFPCYGYVAATIDYGLVPDVSIIEQSENVLDSIQYLKDTLPEYIDENNIIVLGASAGAHLGMLAVERLTAADSAYSYDFNVKLAVTAFGPLDFEYFINNHVDDDMAFYIMNHVDTITSGLAQTYEEAIQILSPSKNLNPELPRVLVIHGTADDVVPIAQSRAFYHQLLENGTEADFIEVKNGGHYLANKEFAEPIFQYIQEYTKGQDGE